MTFIKAKQSAEKSETERKKERDTWEKCAASTNGTHSAGVRVCVCVA